MGRTASKEETPASSERNTPSGHASPAPQQRKSPTEELWEAVARAVTEVHDTYRANSPNEEADMSNAIQEVMDLALCAANATRDKIERKGPGRSEEPEDMYAKAIDPDQPGPSRNNADVAQRLSRATDAFRMLQEQLLFLEIALILAEDNQSDAESGREFRNLRRVGDRAIEHPWTKKRQLGEGAFGTVYSAVDKNGFEFAVKEGPRDGQEEASIRDEVRILNKLSHRHIVRCYGCAGDADKIYMYIELMEGSISDKMKKAKTPCSETLARKYTKDMLQGLIYLHSQSIVHRDLKCANVLLDNRDRAKLGDFGISKTHARETLPQYEHQQGTLFWMSPEAMEKKQVGRRSDMWAVGCTVYEMLKAAPPFLEELCNVPLLIPLRLPKYVLEIRHRQLISNDNTLSRKLKTFLLRVFVTMDERPFAEDLAQDPWVR